MKTQKARYVHNIDPIQAKKNRGKLITMVAGTIIGLGLLTLLGLGAAGCKDIRKQNTEAADYIASKYVERLDKAKTYLAEGDTSKAKSIAVRTLNDINSFKKSYDVGFGGYGGELPDFEAYLLEIASYK